MNAVLIDNWTLHNVANLIYTPSFPCGATYEDLENLIMGILLWDNIYYWDNGNSGWWQSAFDGTNLLPPLEAITSIDIPQAHGKPALDIVTDGAEQYQLLAISQNIDYLPERERYNFLRTCSTRPKANVTNWQLHCINRAKSDIENIYIEVARQLECAPITFRFPLLVDYLFQKTGSLAECIPAAIHMKHEKSLCAMRSWLYSLHSSLDAGDWTEVYYCNQHIDDVVSSVNSLSHQSVEVQIGIPFSASISHTIDMSKKANRAPLTFIRDLANFSLHHRPQN